MQQPFCCVILSETKKSCGVCVLLYRDLALSAFLRKTVAFLCGE